MYEHILLFKTFFDKCMRLMKVDWDFSVLNVFKVNPFVFYDLETFYFILSRFNIISSIIERTAA